MTLTLANAITAIGVLTMIAFLVTIWNEKLPALASSAMLSSAIGLVLLGAFADLAANANLRIRLIAAAVMFIGLAVQSWQQRQPKTRRGFGS